MKTIQGNHMHTHTNTVKHSFSAWFLAIFCILGLSACGSNAPSVQYYTLDNTTSRNVVNNQQVLALGPIELASFLNDRNMHILNAGNKVTISQYHQWAESLSESLQRTLSSDLEKYTNMAVLKASETSKTCGRVSLRVEKFSPNSAGQVQFSGRWFYHKNRDLISSQNFFYEKKLEQDGFTASTHMLRTLVDSLAMDISKAIKPQVRCD